MNIQNLNSDELKQLQELLNKMNPQTQPIVKDPFEEMINNIMDEFNFAKVQNVMFRLDWRWSAIGIPTIDDLKKEAERLLRGAAESRLGDFLDSHWEIGIANNTGGFEAKAWCDESKKHITDLGLKFVVEHWESSIEN